MCQVEFNCFRIVDFFREGKLEIVYKILLGDIVYFGMFDNEMKSIFLVILGYLVIKEILVYWVFAC